MVAAAVVCVLWPSQHGLSMQTGSALHCAIKISPCCGLALRAWCSITAHHLNPAGAQHCASCAVARFAHHVSQHAHITTHAGARHAHALRSRAHPHAHTSCSHAACCSPPPQVDVIEASSVTEALAVLGVADKDSDEKHPEKRMKAAWLAFQERELPALKLEKPGLRINQYKEMLWKAWQKHPDNPIVQAQRQQQGLA